MMTPSRVPRVVASLAGAAALCLAWGYGSAVFLLGELGSKLWYLSIIALGVTAYAALSSAVRRHPSLAERATSLAMGTLSSVASILIADVAYAIYLNATMTPSPSAETRVFDRNIWVGELYPPLYYPTPRNFRIHKPGVSATGTHFGGFYHPSMLASPTLVDHVLESRPISVVINDRGFRESSSMAEATVFALGDSFTFGWGVDEASPWPRILESLSGRTVYNLGVHDASPRQELELLDFVLRTYPDSHGISHLLWMIYEGNDLDASLRELRPDLADYERPSLWQGTVLALVESLPGAIRTQSILWKLRTGRVNLETPVVTGVATDPYRIDGVRLVRPLYHSRSLGWRIFGARHIELVQEDESDVAGNPNRERLEAVFERMAALADSFDFEVTVVLAPTGSRVHGPHFEGFPELSARPHFLDFVSDLADERDFRVVDLYQHLAPLSASELFYFRDDDHFNERGHEVVAAILQRELFSR